MILGAGCRQGQVVLHKCSKLSVLLLTGPARESHTLPAEMQGCSANQNPLLAENPHRLAPAVRLGKKATWQPSQNPHMAAVTSAAVE